jgi:hypothetical protein
VQVVTGHYTLKEEAAGSSEISVTDKTSRRHNNRIKIVTNKHMKFQSFLLNY